ncbi:MAG: helicase HerA domain-containing protein, partial [Candidatus Lutacidiplasmatales archaeon]
ASGALPKAELLLAQTGEDGRPAQLQLESESAEELSRAIAGRRQELYRAGISLRTRARSRTIAERGRGLLLRRLSVLGFRARIPAYETGCIVQPPRLDGRDHRPIGYWHTLSTDGVAAFFPFVDESVVEPGGILLGLLLDDTSPVFLDRWSHASHSWGLFGATGSGKSFAAALWAVRSRWMVPELEIYILDPLGEFTGLANALGGTVLSFGPSASSHWHPLDPVTTGGDRVEKAARVGVLLRSLFPSLKDEEAARLETAVARLYATGPGVPSFSDLQEEIRRAPGDPGRLVELLEVFRTGSLRHLDRPTSAPLDANLLVFDLHDVPESQRAFHLTYVLDGLYHR